MSSGEAHPAAGGAAEATPDWENSKENFQPLKAGRKPAALRDCTADVQREALEAQRRWVGGFVCGWCRGWLTREGRGWGPRCGGVAGGLDSAVGEQRRAPQARTVTPRRAVRPPHPKTSPHTHARCCSAFWEELASYKGEDPLEVWLRCALAGCGEQAPSPLLASCTRSPSPLRAPPHTHHAPLTPSPLNPCARRFIRWAQEAHPAGGHKAELLPLLERCTRELQGVARYADDVCYLRVWVQYVSEGRVGREVVGGPGRGDVCATSPCRCSACGRSARGQRPTPNSPHPPPLPARSNPPNTTLARTPGRLPARPWRRVCVPQGELHWPGPCPLLHRLCNLPRVQVRAAALLLSVLRCSGWSGAGAWVDSCTPAWCTHARIGHLHMRLTPCPPPWTRGGRGNYARADSVYQHGINVLAAPVERLRAKYQEFQHRMVGGWDWVRQCQGTSVAAQGR